MNQVALTNEEKSVIHYNNNSIPTNSSQVTHETPLDELYLNWSEKELPEKLRTRHVHRLHPYLGKYIPQLVEVFLRKYLKPGDTVLDPFSGSGTTLVQANELGINAIGCDISKFNTMITDVKTRKYDINKLEKEVQDLFYKFSQYTPRNTQPDLFLEKRKFNLKTKNKYLNEWFAPQALKELLLFKELIEDYEYKDFFKLVLSRSARSARLTTHFDLDFPPKPITEPYYCYKHSRICKPTDDASKFLQRYTLDSFERVKEFSKYRTKGKIKQIHGDSRFVKFPKVDCVITSPPYVGLIDYHEQHKYAYELLGIDDHREEEIGAAAKGRSKAAVSNYKNEIAEVLINSAKSLKKGGKLIVVAGDKSNLYPEIGEMAKLKLEDKIERHVNRRTGRRNGAFFETIFIYTK